MAADLMTEAADHHPGHVAVMACWVVLVTALASSGASAAPADEAAGKLRSLIQVHEPGRASRSFESRADTKSWRTAAAVVGDFGGRR
jgi:hypothetical protein